MSKHSPRDAAKELLRFLALPVGAVSILPYHQGDDVTMHVMVSPDYIKRIQVPESFEGYRVVVQARPKIIAGFAEQRTV
ncbi:hypothetical protein [Undibacterium sp. Tian12W]|uniref:hypothetical protein n=1 Tax=Undibacterium sp. Tian12W TaxID=3413054 RepID=UPI003BF2894F